MKLDPIPRDKIGLKREGLKKYLETIPTLSGIIVDHFFSFGILCFLLPLIVLGRMNPTFLGTPEKFYQSYKDYCVGLGLLFIKSPRFFHHLRRKEHVGIQKGDQYTPENWIKLQNLLKEKTSLLEIIGI